MRLNKKYFLKRTKSKRTHTKEEKRETINIPSKFSIESYRDDVLGVFSKISSSLHIGPKEKKIFINLHNVEETSASTLMYLISIFTNSKNKCIISSNNPKDLSCSNLFSRYGFYKFVSSVKKVLPLKDEDTFQITTGNCVDTDIAKKITTFIKKHQCACSDVDIYATLIELMGNAHQHAYIKTEAKPVYEWLVFAEYRDKTIELVFFDNGDGIPSTVRKNFIDKIKDAFEIRDPETHLISSALNGEFRTQTEQTTRGRGLPQIASNLRSKYTVDARLYSGKGCCFINDGEIIIQNDSKLMLNGTLLIWKFKGDLPNDKHND